MKNSKTQKHYDSAVKLYASEKYDEALEKCEIILGINPNDTNALNLKAAVFAKQGRNEDAKNIFELLLRMDPKNAAQKNNLGSVLAALGKFEEAKLAFTQAIAINERYHDPHYNLGNLYSSQSRFNDAIFHFSKAIELKPDHHPSYNNLGICLIEIGKNKEAVELYDFAIKHLGPHPRLYINKAKALHSAGLLNTAATELGKCLDIYPDNFECLTVLGDTLRAKRDISGAAACYQKALTINPKSAPVHNNYAILLMDAGSYDDAIRMYTKAFDLDNQRVEALMNAANIYNFRQDFRNSLLLLDKAYEVKPSLQYLRGMRLYAMMHTCSWECLAEAKEDAISSIRRGEKVSNPFPPVAFLEDPELLTKVAELWVADQSHPSNLPPIEIKKQRKSRIRLAYFSADFHTHATSHLITRLFEHHDRSSFEIIGLSFGPIKHDETSNRVRKSFDTFIDIRGYSDIAVAQYCREVDVDIAIDLKGFTQDSRPGIFSARAAPIQINYLGFPGSMGAHYMDYIIADRTVIPEELKIFYKEKVLYMPDCYQVNDDLRPLTDPIPTRESLGLPPEGFIFCSFNNSFKITPEIFTIWMELLGRVSGSVLWLIKGNDSAEFNLRKEARRRGIDPDRLIFAERVSLDKHLIRHQIADLFLDTYPCNAHTTASDSLRAGIPLVTRIGKTFPSRVASSLLNAIGLPELIAEDENEYKSIALNLASDPHQLTLTKAKLQRNRISSGLFNAATFCSSFEEILKAIYSTHKN